MTTLYSPFDSGVNIASVAIWLQRRPQLLDHPAGYRRVLRGAPFVRVAVDSRFCDIGNDVSDVATHCVYGRLRADIHARARCWISSHTFATDLAVMAGAPGSRSAVASHSSSVTLNGLHEKG